MKLAQIRNAAGGVTAAIAADGGYRLIGGETIASLILEAERLERDLAELADEMASSEAVNGEAIIPVNPAEVWACGCTYAPSAEFRDAEHGDRKSVV